MEVDTAQMPPEKLKAIKEGLCFCCQEKGHLAQDCPMKKGKAPAMATRVAETLKKPETAKKEVATAQTAEANTQKMIQLLKGLDNETQDKILLAAFGGTEEEDF